MRRRVTVIITAHDAQSTIEVPLRALAAQVLPSDVEMTLILVDDRSEDETSERARAYLATSPLVATQLRIATPPSGPGTARLAALALATTHATGESLVLLDADAWIDEDFITRMLGDLERAHVVSPPIRYRPAAPHRESRFVAAWLGVDAAYYHAICAVVAARGHPPGVCFGGIAMRRDTLDRSGGLEAIGFTLTEDLAFARLAHGAGASFAFPCRGGASVAGCPSFASLCERAARVSAAGGASVLAVALAAPVLTLPLLALGALAGVVPPWLPIARWLLGATILHMLVTGRDTASVSRRELFAACLGYEVSMLAIAALVALRLGRSSTVAWGGVSYARRPVDRSSPTVGGT